MKIIANYDLEFEITAINYNENYVELKVNSNDMQFIKNNENISQNYITKEYFIYVYFKDSDLSNIFLKIKEYLEEII